MNRFVLAAVGTGALLLGGMASVASAQAPIYSPIRPPTNQPPVSPYLNLLRQGSSPGVNYYDLVRPQQEFRNNYQQLQQDITAGQQQAYGPVDISGLPATGHFAQFNTQGRYFMTRGAAGTTNGTQTGATPYRSAATSTPQAPTRPPAR